MSRPTHNVGLSAHQSTEAESPRRNLSIGCTGYSTWAKTAAVCENMPIMSVFQPKEAADRGRLPRLGGMPRVRGCIATATRNN